MHKICSVHIHFASSVHMDQETHTFIIIICVKYIIYIIVNFIKDDSSFEWFFRMIEIMSCNCRKTQKWWQKAYAEKKNLPSKPFLVSIRNRKISEIGNFVNIKQFANRSILNKFINLKTFLLLTCFLVWNQMTMVPNKQNMDFYSQTCCVCNISKPRKKWMY